MRYKPSVLLLIGFLAISFAQEEELEDDVEYPDLDEVELAEEDDSWIPELELGATISLDLRHLTEPPHTFTYNENDIALRVTTKWEKAEAAGSLRLRGLGFSSVSDSADLEHISYIDP
ncbi:hypothetical protein KAU45_06730, partial [bacterium]|nr:hypothetical protein [bacterium]